MIISISKLIKITYSYWPYTIILAYTIILTSKTDNPTRLFHGHGYLKLQSRSGAQSQKSRAGSVWKWFFFKNKQKLQILLRGKLKSLTWRQIIEIQSWYAIYKLPLQPNVFDMDLGIQVCEKKVLIEILLY